jgi:hypothetical protein
MSLADSALARWRSDTRRTGSSRSKIYALDWILAATPLALVFGQLLLLGANSGILSSAAALVSMLTLALILGVAPRAAPSFGEILPVVGLSLAAGAWAFIVGPTSIVPSAAPLEVAKLMGFVAMLLMGVVVGGRRARSKLFCGILSGVGSLYALAAFWLYEADPFRVMGVVKVAHAWRFTGTLLNANAAGVVFGIVCLASLGWLQSLFGRTRAANAKPVFLSIGLASVLVNLIACAFTASRMAFAVTVLLGVLLCLVELISARAPDAAGRTSRLAALTIVGGLILLGVGLGAGKVLFRDEGVVDTFNGRMQVLGHFTALAQQRPVTGWGLGAFDQINQSSLRAPSADYMYAFGAAHSAAIKSVLVGGLPYFLILASMGLTVIVGVVRNWTRIQDGWSRGLAAAVLLAALCSIDDIDLNVPAVAALAALALGVLWGRALSVDGRAALEPAQ